jgi:hypothetical protein
MKVSHIVSQPRCLTETDACTRAVSPGPVWSVWGEGVVDGQVVWTSPKPLFGDAPVEFWPDGKLIGRARPSRDNRTFSLPGKTLGDLSKVEVRAGGRRLDAPDPRFEADNNQAPAGLPPLSAKGSPRRSRSASRGPAWPAHCRTR